MPIPRTPGSPLIVSALLAALFVAAPAQERIASSTVSGVTVFSDRAQVTRTMAATLPAGDQSVIFDHLPEMVDPASLTVDGSGNCLLREVKFRQQPFSAYADSLTRALNNQKRTIEEAIAAADDKLKQLGDQRQFTENIAQKVTEHGSSQPAAQPELDSQKWQRMLDFYGTRLASIDDQVRATNRSKAELNDSLTAVTIRIADQGRDPRASRNQAVVSLYLREAGPVSLDLSYVVYGPSWSPSYELRAKTEAKSLTVIYKANLRQNTGEDWTAASVKLSTAQPSIGGRQPELVPWRIDFAAPPIAYGRLSAGFSKKEQLSYMSNMAVGAAGGGSGAPAPAAPPMDVAQATVAPGTVNAVFEIPGKTTVKSDNEEHTATIMSREFAATFRYSTVPKLSTHAFLKAKIKNETDYPLLAGNASVFLDNAFVANSTVDQVAPGQEFWTFLGVDEGIRVEHRLVNRLQEREGLLSKKTKITFEYAMTVTNSHKSEEEIVVWDQLPIPANEEIKVELIEPKYKGDTPQLTKNDQGFLEWYYKLKPSEKVEIPLKFSVEFPEGKTVPGL